MKHIVSFSGGKDSTAMLLRMLEEGCCQETINNVVVNVQIATAEELYDYITRGKQYENER